MKKTFLILFLLLLAGCSEEKLKAKDIITFEKKDGIVSYAYLGEKSEAKKLMIKNKELTEDISKRKNTSVYFRNGNEETMISYSGLPFLKVNGEWRSVEYATATDESFKKVSNGRWFNEALLSLLGEEARADTYSAFAGAGDGYAEKLNQGTWAEARDATTGSVGATGTADGEAGVAKGGTGAHSVMKSFFPFKVAYPAEATSLSCLISLYINSGNNNVTDTYDYAVFTYGNPAATSTLAAEDINNFTDIAYTASTSQDTLIANVGHNTFALNAVGLAALTNNAWNEYAWRSGNDVKNTALADNSTSQIVYADTSEYAGTDHDPFISCTYTLPFVPNTGSQIIIIE